jgi:hypothetical protein
MTIFDGSGSLQTLAQTRRTRYLSAKVAQLQPQTPGSLFVAFYDSQGYGGGIRPHVFRFPPRT